MGGAAGGIVGSVVSTGLGMMANYREVKAANQAAEYNAQAYEAQAKYNAAGYEQQAQYTEREYGALAEGARTRGAFDLSLLRRGQAQAFGKMAQGIANSGVRMNSGSAVRMLAEQRGLDAQGQKVQKYNTELEATGYLRRGANEAHGYRQRSAIETNAYLQQAAMYRAQKRSPWGAMLGTAVDGIGAVSSQYSKYRMLTAGGCGNAGALGGSSLSFGFP